MGNNTVDNKGTGIDSAQLFGAVASNLSKNRDSLNKADTYNSDHGNNMVDIFQSSAKKLRANQMSVKPASWLRLAMN